MRKGWKNLPLSQVADIKFSTVDKKTYDGQKSVILCNYTDVFYNKKITSEISFMPSTASNSEIDKFSLKKGDVVFTKDSETAEDIGICAYVAEDIPNLVCGYHLGIARSKPNICLGDYLAIIMNFHPVHHQLIRVANGVTRYGLTLDSISQAYIPIPPISEQKKISSILRTWDEGIERASNLLAAQTKKKQALQQKLMSGKKRLPGFSGAWKNRSLKELTKEIKDRNQDSKMGANKIMGVNKIHGLIPMREETIGAAINRYKKVPSNAFAYNPMRINIGSLAKSRYDYTVLVSPDYVVFSCIPEKLDVDYFDHFRRGHAWEKFMEASGNGSVRIRIYYEDLGNLKIRLPEIKEQKAIAAILNACDQQLQLIEKEIEALKAQKRGLMQKLLTGEWPVHVNKEAA